MKRVQKKGYHWLKKVIESDGEKKCKYYWICIAEEDDMHNEDEYRQLEAENKRLKQLLKENGNILS